MKQDKGGLDCHKINSSDEARLDVSVRSFWQRGQRAFYDVRVFNPFAKSHLNQKSDSEVTRTKKKDNTTNAS